MSLFTHLNLVLRLRKMELHLLTLVLFYAIVHIYKSNISCIALHPLNPSGNYMFHLFYQSVTPRFVFVGFV
jgi:hypothetical protein